jgi:DNA-directed RNA polymerase specialized sigma24 family protein
MKPHTLRRPGRKNKLLIAFKAGDLQAYARLMRRYQDFVNRTAFDFTNDKAKAIEVAIRAFMKLWNEREKIPDNASLMAYLRKFVGEIVFPHEN